MWGQPPSAVQAATFYVAAATPTYNPAPAIIATFEANMRNLFFVLCLALATTLATAQQYDLVLEEPMP